MIVQADASQRDMVSDLARIQVRGRDNQLIPLSNLVTPREIAGPTWSLLHGVASPERVSGLACHGVGSFLRWRIR